MKRLPASARSAATEAAATEASKASATETTSTKASTTEAASSKASAHGNPDGAGAAAGIVLAVVIGELGENDCNGDDEKDNEPEGETLVAGIFVLAELS